MAATDTGTARDAAPADPLPLFPLRTVLFPGARLALRVFEARYLDLVSECLRTQRPFGVVCLKSGAEAGRQGRSVELEQVGTLAHIEQVDSETSGILHIRCRGGQRFRLAGDPEQRANGLWVCRSTPMAADAARAPGPAVQRTVDALAQAIASLSAQGVHPFIEPSRLDDAGWVANRWCELLPVSLSAKQKLMELDDPVIRLSLVDGFLRDKKIVLE
ncbi:MAG: LON peptidase substrate-binding domain-containing protein [Rubrivivax sp.]|jgi:hypothetical protein|nr:LON peptidase substrate-binding domain-containing protein [Rubrivivax sp.]